MRVLSLFDGMSCGQIALNRIGKTPSIYFASEIDKHAIAVTQANYPETKQLGDVCNLDTKKLGSIDLLIGGSPCQSISNLGKKEGLDGKSGLFYEYLRCLEEISPKNFLLENVVGNKLATDTISKLLGVEPILFNSNLVSGQNRARLYWTNIEFSLPKNKDIFLLDVLDEVIHPTSILTESRLKWLTSEKGQGCIKKRYASIDPVKAQCLTARSDASWNCNYVTRSGVLTKLSVEEYEKLQHTI